MSFQIIGLGTAIPRELVSQDDAARMAIELRGSIHAQTGVISALYRRTGVLKRHCVVLTTSTNGQPAQQSFFQPALNEHDQGPTTADRMRRYESDALDLAAEAAWEALQDANCRPKNITDLVTVSCTGFSAPGVDIGLVRCLGLANDVSRTHIGFMGCHGALNGLRVAGAIRAASESSCVLVCCVELCSLHQQYTSNAQGIVANALFSDGAAAVVGAGGRSNDDGWTVVGHRSCLLPNTADLMSWRVRDHGFEMTLSPQVPATIQNTIGDWLRSWLAEYSLDICDIRGWAIHPGGPRVLSACGEAMGLDAAALEPSRQVLAEFGNMSSPTVLFILEQLRRQADCLPCVVMAFGPGLTIEAALIR